MPFAVRREGEEEVIDRDFVSCYPSLSERLVDEECGAGIARMHSASKPLSQPAMAPRGLPGAVCLEICGVADLLTNFGKGAMADDRNNNSRGTGYSGNVE